MAAENQHEIVIEEQEAEQLCKYLINKPSSPEIKAAYRQAVVKQGVYFNPEELALWRKMMTSGFMLRIIDSGLALIKPTSILRKRIFIMLCILETDKHYTKYFLPVKRSIFYLIPLGVRVLRGCFSAIFGIIALKIMKTE